MHDKIEALGRTLTANILYLSGNFIFYTLYVSRLLLLTKFTHGYPPHIDPSPITQRSSAQSVSRRIVILKWRYIIRRRQL